MSRLAGSWIRRLVVVAAWGCPLALTVLAGWADVAVRQLTTAGTVLDLLVGVSLCVGGLLAPTAPTVQRGLIWATGVAWLMASLLPLASLHQATLLALFGSFPSGKVRGLRGWTSLVMAVLVWTGVGGQIIAGLAFLAVAGLSLRPGRGARAWLPVAAGGALGVVLTGAGLVAARWPLLVAPATATLAYELVLIGTAVAFPLVCRSYESGTARAVREVLREHRDQPFGGRLHALSAMLGHGVGDPRLDVVLLDQQTGRFLDAGGTDRTSSLDDSWLPVGDPVAPVAWIRIGSDVVLDPAAGQALLRAVHLVAESVRLEAERQHRLAELREARLRIIESVDRQRTLLAHRLEASVAPPLRTAHEELAVLGSCGIDGDAEIVVARQELAKALADMDAVARGAPPVDLGGGRLVRVLEDLVERTPAVVAIDVDGPTSSTRQIETVCYYACAEALTNAVKHAEARKIHIRLARSGGWLELTVSDDGKGGADSGGTGLSGLRERVRAVGGEFEVTTADEQGTTIAARLPLVGDQSMRSHGFATS
jgi:signal transduction histidine kinase